MQSANQIETALKKRREVGPRGAELRTEQKRAGSRAHFNPNFQPAGPLAYLLLALVTLIAFAPILGSDLLWTDYDEVERTAFSAMENWSDAWKTEHIQRYDPISTSSYFLEKQLPGPTAPAHRLINILLHLAAALFLLRLLETFRLPGAFAASIVFALHPAALQTLFWPGYRGELVGLVFILATLFYSLRASGSKAYGIALLLAAASMLIHPAAMALPVLIALALFFTNHTWTLQSFNRVLPIACLALFALVWTKAATQFVPEGEALSADTIAGQNMVFYLNRAFFPTEFSLFHPYSFGETYSVGATNSLLAFLIFIPFFVLVGFNFRKRWARGMLFALGGFLALLLHDITQPSRFLNGALAKEDQAVYIALPAASSIVICGVAGFLGNSPGLGRMVWKLGITLFLILQMSLTTFYAYSVSDQNRMWQALVEQWPDAWQPKAALVESTQATEKDFLSTARLTTTLEKILQSRPDRKAERLRLARLYRDSRQNSNALREYRYILRENEPTDEILEEAAMLMESLGLDWEARNARARIDNNSTLYDE